MKILTFVFMIVIIQSGCAIAPKGEAIRAAADGNVFEGLDKNSKLSISIPSPHSGAFDSVDQLNFQIDKGKSNERNASAILGKSQETGDWEVISIMINENGKWTKLIKEN